MRSLLIATGLYAPLRAARRALRSPGTRRSEAATLAFFRALLAPGTLAFDLGANVGEMSEALLKVGARVVAVEPQPECLRDLRARCAGRAGLTVLPAVVGGEAGVATLHLHRHHAASSLHPAWFGAPVGTLDVPVLTLAALIARYGVPGYCKVDVEGWEEEVFSTLPGPLPLVSFEYLDHALDRALRCVRLLARGQDAEVNVTTTLPLRFAHSAWIPAGEFLAAPGRWLPPGVKYGDLWVRRRGAPEE